MLKNVKITLVTLFVAIVLAFVLYRSCGPDAHLDVDPDARRQIEKAKRR